MSLPTGTVTFLFTDIEGSTRLWEEQPEAMRLALAEHDRLLRECIEAARGYVFKTIGDAFCAAFQHAADAVGAATESQRALTGESGVNSGLKVRMAVHAGSVESRGDDYFGQPLNRIARLLAAGHGGQVVLSDVAHDLCRDTLPAGCTVKPLGEHRLKDLGRPESVFQLCHPDLPADFPPLRSLDNPELPNNLPQQVTSFIGREKELEQISRMCKKTRLLTLTGSGGCGKTRLALQVAADMVDDSGAGVWLVALAPVSDPLLVPETVAESLGLKEEPGRSISLTLLDHLKWKRLLIVLDNCEHLLSACATLADTMLRSCPNMRILATSRERLGIAGETTYRVPSLSTPDPRQAHTTESLSPYESVRLFVSRAEQVLPGFEVTNQNAPALASICHRLDGIPLAIELAAARVRSMSVEEVNQRLDQRFRLLTGGSRTALPRHQTLRSLIDWSYDLLSETERVLFRHLSVFAGGWTLEDAEKVCSGGAVEDWAVLDLLTSLCDKSLAVADPSDGSTRYRMLETVRQYASDRLAENGEAEASRNRHLAHFLAFAEEAEPHLLGREVQTWQTRLETEHDNLRSALAWATEDGGEPESALRICGAMLYFWLGRGYFVEGRHLCRTALERSNQGMQTSARAATLHCEGRLAYAQGDYGSARTLFEESLSIWREVEDLGGVAQALNGLGLVSCDLGDYDAALNSHEQSLAIRRELGDPWTISQSLNNLGVVEAAQGNYSSARSFLQESLSIRQQELGIHRGTAIVLHSLGRVAYLEGEYAAARSLLEESLSMRREVADLPRIAESLMDLGSVSLELGELGSAHSRYQESLSIWYELNDQEGLAKLQASLAELWMARGQHLVAARFWGAAEALREAIGVSVWVGDQKRHDAKVAASRAMLGNDAAFDTAWKNGRSNPWSRRSN